MSSPGTSVRRPAPGPALPLGGALQVGGMMAESCRRGGPQLGSSASQGMDDLQWRAREMSGSGREPTGRPSVCRPDGVRSRPTLSAGCVQGGKRVGARWAGSDDVPLYPLVSKSVMNILRNVGSDVVRTHFGCNAFAPAEIARIGLSTVAKYVRGRIGDEETSGGQGLQTGLGARTDLLSSC